MASRTGWTGRVLIGAVAAMVLIALAAVPSFGASKKFTLDVTPNQTTSGISTDFTITVTNTTPGNSTINSVLVDIPFPLQSGTTATASILPPPDSTNTNASATASPVGSQVRVQNMDSLKRDQVIKIRITATFADPSPGSCTSPSQLWNVGAFAGNSQSGDTFANQSSDAQRTLTLNSASCIHLQFVTDRAPRDAIQDQTITSTDLTPTGQAVQVALMAGTTPVDVTTSGGAVSLSISEFNGSVVPPGTAPGVLANFMSDFSHGVATFTGGLKISNALNPPTAGGDYRLKASYLSYPSVPSAPFRIFDAQICGAGSPEGEETYTEDSQFTTGGQIEIQTTNDACFAIIVDNTDRRGTGAGNVEQWTVEKSTATNMKGFLDINWELPGTTPVKWTEVIWVGLSDYQPVQRCNPGVYPPDFDAQFPSGQEMCLVSSVLVQNGAVWEQQEVIAYDTDYGGRK